MDSGPAPLGASPNDRGLPPEIQPAFRKASVDARGIDHEPDPWPHDRGIGQVDVFPDQAIAALAARIDQSMPSAVIPIEPQIDPLAHDPALRAALLPRLRRIAGDGRIGAAVPAARPDAVERIG